MDAQETQKIIDAAVKNYCGDLDVLESAIGTFVFGRQVGWKPLFVVHHRATIKRYEKILAVSFRDVLPDVGPLAHRCVAWQMAQKVSNFWKAVRGEVPDIKTPKFEGG